MGRRILQQRAGRGGFPYRVPSHKRLGDVRYLPYDYDEPTFEGTLTEFKHETGRGAPLAIVHWDSGEKMLYLPPEGLPEGIKIQQGPNAATQVGNIKPLYAIPEGTLICNVELKPGDGGAVARSSGMSATLLEHHEKNDLVQLPSGAKITLDKKCRATIGVVAGGGRTEKPFVKAGNKFYWVRAKGRKWPRSRGIAMNAQSHPFGGGKHRGAHQPKTISRDAPPGKKVGLIAARRTGLRKK